jgi:hypothetical protein
MSVNINDTRGCEDVDLEKAKRDWRAVVLLFRNNPIYSSTHTPHASKIKLRRIGGCILPPCEESSPSSFCPQQHHQKHREWWCVEEDYNLPKAALARKQRVLLQLVCISSSHTCS